MSSETHFLWTARTDFGTMNSARDKEVMTLTKAEACRSNFSLIAHHFVLGEYVSSVFEGVDFSNGVLLICWVCHLGEVKGCEFLVDLRGFDPQSSCVNRMGRWLPSAPSAQTTLTADPRELEEELQTKLNHESLKIQNTYYDNDTNDFSKNDIWIIK